MKPSRPPLAGRVASLASTYPVLLVLIGAVYVFGVVRVDALLGLSPDWLAAPQILAAGLIALVTQPVERRLRGWTEQLIHGRRTPGYDVLDEISVRSGDVGRDPPRRQPYG